MEDGALAVKNGDGREERVERKVKMREKVKVGMLSQMKGVRVLK